MVTNKEAELVDNTEALKYNIASEVGLFPVIKYMQGSTAQGLVGLGSAKYPSEVCNYEFKVKLVSQVGGFV